MSRERFYTIADKYALELYGEFGYDTCDEEQKENIWNIVIDIQYKEETENKYY